MAFDPITALVDFAGGVGKTLIERLIPDPQAKAQAHMELLKMQQTGELALLAAETELAKGQLAINAEEAKSQSLFVSGARPFFMWVCGTAFAYHYIIQPLLAFIMAVYGHPVVLPVFDMEALMTVAMGMLGLGTMRSFEKVKGVSK